MSLSVSFLICRNHKQAVGKACMRKMQICTFTNVENRTYKNYKYYRSVLAGRGRKKKKLTEIYENPSGLSARADHPTSQLKLLHGSILDHKCSSASCSYIDRDNLTSPIAPCLSPATAEEPSPSSSSTTNDGTTTTTVSPLLDPARPLPQINPRDLPHCPLCTTSLLRPGVVWFGEGLDPAVLSSIEDWLDDRSEGGVKVMLVIGTAAAVYPAAGYVAKARERGAVVAVINPDRSAGKGLRANRDFWFRGDAAEVLPRVLEGVIGRGWQGDGEGGG